MSDSRRGESHRLGCPTRWFVGRSFAGMSATGAIFGEADFADTAGRNCGARIPLSGENKEVGSKKMSTLYWGRRCCQRPYCI